MFARMGRLGGALMSWFAAAGIGLAQYVPADLPLTQLPTEQAYQKSLRAFLGSLSEADLHVELKKLSVAKGNADPDDAFRRWLLSLHIPDVGAAALPASAFTLRALEAGKGILLPTTPNMSQALAWLAHWDDRGNPYFGSAALQRRALVLAAVDMMLLDYLYDHNPRGSDRSDFLGGNLIWLGYTYKHCKDVAPAEAKLAFEAGLKRLVARLNGWGPRGAMTDMDLFAAVGLRYVSEALGDPEVTKTAEQYARRLFTDPRFFHPAGYFVDVGCFDTSYNGISLYFAIWTALASDWPFAREAVEKGYRLRAHLSLPEPVGGANGPSHMSSRTSADPPHDQWNFPHRPYAAALVTDEALHLAPLPAPKAMEAAAERVVFVLNAALAAPRPAKVKPWEESHWSGMLNFAHEHYPRGHYTRRLALEKSGSPLLKPLYERNERFQHEFAKAFLVTRSDDYAAVIHTGPVRGWPYGFGGGQLSAFWTPAAGPALLGRRRGMQGAAPDSLDAWRTWPVHAVSGLTAQGDFVSSTLLAQPGVEFTAKGRNAEVNVEGPLRIGKGDATMSYQRRFVAQPSGLTVRTALHAKQRTSFKELYETLPVFLHDSPQAEQAKVIIQVQVGDQWLDATPRPQANVVAIRVDRFQGAVQIKLDRPRIVQLAPTEWQDSYQTRATCRTVLVDLLENGGQPKMVDANAIEYTLTSVPRPAAKK